MLTKEVELLIPFVKEPWKKRTFKEIKKLSKKTSDSYVFTSLKGFVKQGFLKEESAGNVVLYSLNLAEMRTQNYAGFLAENQAWNTKHLPFPLLKNIIGQILTPYYTFIVTGSYARNKQKPTSDIDIVLIIDEENDPKSHYAQIRHTCELSIPPGHPYVFRKSEFLLMLTNEEFNYGKEIAKNNLILHGGSAYYTIMHEAIKNGFNDTKLS
ncbi:MAG: nucleotidyltransferase domain-containing protein [Nanoarchaeota archaeon]